MSFFVGVYYHMDEYLMGVRLSVVYHTVFGWFGTLYARQVEARNIAWFAQTSMCNEATVAIASLTLHSLMSSQHATCHLSSFS